MSILDDAKLIITPNGYKASKLYSLKPFDGSGDCTVVRATTATRVNSAGLIESVAGNVPRLDYSGGVTCPAILVEPQRTNVLLRSEEFDNGYWIKSGDISVSANTTISPDGNTTADTITKSGVSTFQLLRTPNIAIPSTDRYTFTLYLKKSTLDSSVFLLRNETTFTNINSTITILDGDAVADNTNPMFKKVIVNDLDFVKIQITTDSNITSGHNIRAIIYPDNVSPQASGDIILWGAQLEQGSTPSSYIPTVATAVTRNADVITATPPVGTTEITEYFEDNTTNVISVIPATYTMSEGRISKVVMI